MHALDISETGVCDRAFQIREYLSRNGIRVEGYLVSESYKNIYKEPELLDMKWQAVLNGAI